MIENTENDLFLSAAGYLLLPAFIGSRLIAQAQAEKLLLITADRQMKDYDAEIMFIGE